MKNKKFKVGDKVVFTKKAILSFSNAKDYEFLKLKNTYKIIRICGLNQVVIETPLFKEDQWDNCWLELDTKLHNALQ